MADPEIIERELKKFIEESANLNKQDKYTVLRAIFDKHLAMEKVDFQLTYGDFQEIINIAKANFANSTLPLKISKRDVYHGEAPNVSMVEAVIGFLNKNKLLKRLVKFDYTGK